MGGQVCKRDFLGRGGEAASPPLRKKPFFFWSTLLNFSNPLFYFSFF
jgi:hypothetical protein